MSLGRLSLLVGRRYIQYPRLHHKTRVNQRASRKRVCQVRFSRNVAAGIASNIVVGSCPLHDRLDGDFLEAVLPGMLNSTSETECAFIATGLQHTKGNQDWTPGPLMWPRLQELNPKRKQLKVLQDYCNLLARLRAL